MVAVTGETRGPYKQLDHYGEVATAWRKYKTWMSCFPLLYFMIFQNRK